MRKLYTAAAFMLLLLAPIIAFSSQEQSRWLSEETKIRQAVEDLSSAIIANNSGKVGRLTLCEGIGSSSDARINEFLLAYNRSDLYKCSWIEIVFIRISEDVNHAEACVRVHLSAPQEKIEEKIASARLESWNFVRKNDQWLCVIPR